MDEREEEADAVWRLRSAVAMSDFQMERAIRGATGREGCHAYLSRHPELWDILPWVKGAA